MPFPARSDPGGAHAAAQAPPTRPGPPSSPAAATASSFSSPGAARAPAEPGPAAAAALTRPAGPLDPAGAEEAPQRRPLGGSVARRLLKAPRPPGLAVLRFVCVGAQAGELRDGGRGTGCRVAIAKGLLLFKGARGVMLWPFSACPLGVS